MRILIASAAALLIAAPVVAMPPPVEPGSDRPAPVLGLADAWRLALDRAPALQADEARRDASLEAYAQARGGLLPELGLQAYREDASTDGERIGLTDDGIGIVSSRTDSDTDFAGVSLRQPLVAVDRWIALRQASDARSAAELRLALARERLALRVAESYFGVLGAREAHAVAVAHLAAVHRLGEQVGHRYDAGVVANTDLQEARAARDAAHADEIDARHRVRVAEQALANLIGTRPAGLRAVSAALPTVMPEPADPGWWLERARSAATAVRLAEAGAEVARHEVQRRRAAHYPTVDFIASRTRTDRASTNAFQVADLDGTTLRVELNMPLFAGGIIRSRVREAAAEHRAAGFELEDVRRISGFNTEEAWLEIEAALQRIRAREQAERSAASALSAAEVGAVEGLRTTADVLDAQRQVTQARAAAAQARFDYIIAVLALRASTGLLDDAAIEQVDRWLE